jgi:hypothetical protein
MQKNRRGQKISVAVLTVAINNMKKQYYKPLVITFSVVILDMIFGFDPKFTIINLIWLLPFKINK